MSLSHTLEILDALSTCLDEDHAHAVVEHRRAKRVPLTVHAANLLARQFARCVDPNAAADEMILRGWTGFKAEWVRDHDMTGGARRNGKRTILDAAADRIGRAH